jgi:Rap1a immunity proteins
MKRLLLATVITFAPFVVPAHATDLTGEALALACEGNVPGIKRGKNTEEYAKFCNTYINGWEDAIFAFLKGTTTYCPPQVTVKEMSVVFFDYLAAHKEARRLPAAYSGCNTSSRSRVSNPLARYHNASRRQRIYLQHPRLSIETGATAQCSPEPRRSFSGLGVICHLAPTSVAVTPQGCGQKKSKPNPANYRRSSAGGPNRKRAIDLLEAASRLRHPPYRTLHSLMPPLRLMNSASGSLSFFCICAYRGTLLLLLRVRLSTFTESAAELIATGPPSPSCWAGMFMRPIGIVHDALPKSQFLEKLDLRRALRTRLLDVSEPEDPFAAIIRCTVAIRAVQKARGGVHVSDVRPATPR